jgi:hypothetical protein
MYNVSERLKIHSPSKAGVLECQTRAGSIRSVELPSTTEVSSSEALILDVDISVMADGPAVREDVTAFISDDLRPVERDGDNGCRLSRVGSSSAHNSLSRSVNDTNRRSTLDCSA